MLAVMILKMPELGTMRVGESLEWLFYFILPNFCFSAALQDLSYKHQMDEYCSRELIQLIQLIKPPDPITHCELVANKNETSLCCPGELVSCLCLPS